MNRHYKWAVVGMLWFVCFFNYADRQAVFSVFPKLKSEFGFDPVQLGLIGSAFMGSTRRGRRSRAFWPTACRASTSSWAVACFGAALRS